MQYEWTKYRWISSFGSKKKIYLIKYPFNVVEIMAKETRLAVMGVTGIPSSVKKMNEQPVEIVEYRLAIVSRMF